jgi:hypothetical protein
MEVQGRRRTTRIVGLELREASIRLGAAGLDGQATGLEPDVGEAVTGSEAIRLGGSGRGPHDAFSSAIPSRMTSEPGRRR